MTDTVAPDHDDAPRNVDPVDDVLRAAFDTVVDRIESNTVHAVWHQG